jgi:ATP diphosphatase
MLYYAALRASARHAGDAFPRPLQPDDQLERAGLRPKSTTDLDALRHAMQVQSEAAAVGFDWDATVGVLDKVLEEAQEIRDALDAGDPAHARQELGDLLLVCVNLARFLGTDPGAMLRASTDRFADRVRMAHAVLREQGLDSRTCGLIALDRAWIEAKARLSRVQKDEA